MTTQLADSELYIKQLLVINDTLWNIRSDAGIDRRLLGDALRPNNPTVDLRGLDHLQGKIAASWDAINESIDQALVPIELKAVLGRSQTMFSQYSGVRNQIVERLARGEVVSMSRQEILEISNPGINSVAATSILALDLTERRAKEDAAWANKNMLFAIAAMFISILLACGTSAYLIWRIIWPLKLMTQTMKAVAEGDLTREIPFGSRADEIGKFSDTLRLFRDAAMAKQRMEVEMVKSQAAVQAAETSNRTKSEFLANMSHELRTPLNAILGFSELIVSEINGPGVPKYREYAEDIHGAGAHLLKLINDILDVTKAEAGKLDLSFEVIDLYELIAECSRLMRGRAEERGIRLIVNQSPIPRMDLDRLRTKQVLLNLLSNAIKFTDAGGEVSVTSLLNASGDVVVAVSDTGIGVAADMIPLVFEPFRQADAALARKFEGTGLGLSLVKTLMELQDGEVAMESELGRGTKVMISFPASRCVYLNNAACA